MTPLRKSIDEARRPFKPGDGAWKIAFSAESKRFLQLAAAIVAGSPLTAST